MQTVYHRCCGMDVHKKSVTACVRVQQDNGTVEEQIRHFPTYTEDLEHLRDWLAEKQVASVAMESTGVYWIPVWNVLESQTWQMKLINAQHFKQVPGRKTDVKDSQWLAELEQVGLLRGSFVPPSPLRQLRSLTRLRASLQQEHSRMVQRVQKLLERTNIKLASVASDVMGKSGRRMLQDLAAGKRDPGHLAGLALGKLRKKKADLESALRGQFQPAHGFELKLLLENINHLEKQTAQIDSEIRHLIETEPGGAWERAVRLLDTIPGVDWVLAITIVAEIGADMSQFGSAERLASWAGMCPGNHESAGKRLSGRMRKGNRWLRRALCEAAWAASRTKQTSLQAQYGHLVAKRGKKRAIMAVGHSILKVAYYLISRQVRYREAGAEAFQGRGQQARQRYHTRALQQMGYEVVLTAKAAGSE